MKIEYKHEKKLSKRKMRCTVKITEGYLERKGRTLLEEYYRDLKDSLPHHRGIYVLYRGDQLLSRFCLHIAEVQHNQFKCRSAGFP